MRHWTNGAPNGAEDGNGDDVVYKESEFRKDCYKPGEVASILGISVKTVQNYDKNGLLKSIRLPTNRRAIRREDLLGYLRSTGQLVEDDRRDVIYVRSSQADGLDSRALAVVDRASDMVSPVILRDEGPDTDDRPDYMRLLDMVRRKSVRKVYLMSADDLSESGFLTVKTMFQGYGTVIVVVGA